MVSKLGRQLHTIGLANGHGGRYLGCESAIKVLQSSKILQSSKVPLLWREIIPEVVTGTHHSQLKGVIENSKNLSTAIQRAAKDGYGKGQPGKDLLIIGGDHSCAIGTWSGVASSIRSLGDLGLIWIDAHLDAHTPDTTPSGNYHGMPVSHLLGYGHPVLTSIGNSHPKLKPSNLVFVGARSFEPAEEDLLQKLGVKIFYDDDITQRGIKDVMAEAVDRVSAKTHGFGLSIDIDGFQVKDAPAVGTPEDGGIVAKDFLKFIRDHSMKKLLVTEIVEFMPDRDDENQTSEKLIADLIQEIYLPRLQ